MYKTFAGSADMFKGLPEDVGDNPPDMLDDLQRSSYAEVMSSDS